MKIFLNLPPTIFPPVQKNRWFSLDTSLRNSFCLWELSILMGLKLRWRLVPRSWDINLDIVRHERQDWKCINYWPHSHVYQSPGHSFPFNQIKSLASRLHRWESFAVFSKHFSLPHSISPAEIVRSCLRERSATYPPRDQIVLPSESVVRFVARSPASSRSSWTPAIIIAARSPEVEQTEEIRQESKLRSSCCQASHAHKH